MIEIGRLCLKIAGRDAGKKCVVVDIIDKSYVMVDGEARRKKCNIAHLEPLEKKLDIKKKAKHEEIVEAFKKLGIELKERRAKPKKEKPVKIRKKASKEEATKKGKSKEKTAKQEQPKEKEVKK